MTPIDFFCNPTTIAQKQYEALRMFFVEKKKAGQVAQRFGYTYSEPCGYGFPNEMHDMYSSYYID